MQICRLNTNYTYIFIVRCSCLSILLLSSSLLQSSLPSSSTTFASRVPARTESFTLISMTLSRKISQRLSSGIFQASKSSTKAARGMLCHHQRTVEIPSMMMVVQPTRLTRASRLSAKAAEPTSSQSQRTVMTKWRKNQFLRLFHTCNLKTIFRVHILYIFRIE